MNQSRRPPWAVFALVLTAAVTAWTGCRETEPVEKNRPPETYLVDAPGFSQSGYYINHLFWDGFDPDGAVSHFEITITDSLGDLETAIWHATTRTDSLVRFPAGGDNGLSQVLGNRFYVRAVDLLGRPDPEPAWVFFGARDAQYPEVIFTTSEGTNPDWPTPDDPLVVHIRPTDSCITGFPLDTLASGSSVSFAWTAIDRDSLYGVQVGFIEGFEYRLIGVDNTALGGGVTDTAAAYPEVPSGTHTFVVRARDDGGLVSEYCRYFQVNFDPTCRIRRVRNTCTGEMVKAFRLATRSVAGNGDPCSAGASMPPWNADDVGLPTLPVNPCLPAGYFAPGDTLPAPLDEVSWWFEVDVSCSDPDGTIEDLQSSYGFCSRQPNGSINCATAPWTCAAQFSSAPNETTLVVGPIRPGDTRYIVAGVDNDNQRGRSRADTLDLNVDFKHRLVHVSDREPNDVCNRFSALPGEPVEVCATDELLFATVNQSPGELDAPCAIGTRFADGTEAPYSSNDYNSLPLPGDAVGLEFVAETDDEGLTRWIAEMPIQLWLRDPDGSGWVEYLRWQVDAPPRAVDAFERISRPFGPADGQLTPACFVVRIEHPAPGMSNVPHTLWVDVRDRSRNDSSFAANRTSRQAIEFFVDDIAGTTPTR